MNDNITIRKGTVQETLVFPLYGRSIAHEKKPEIFADNGEKAIMARMDYDFDAANMGTLPGYVYGMRQDMLTACARDYLSKYPDAIIVDIGCGLDTAWTAVDNGRCRLVNIDLPDVIELREKLIPLGEREQNLAHDALDFSWMDKIGAGESNHVFCFSGGVLFYFYPEQVKALIDAMARRFRGGCYVFDYEDESMTARSNRMVKKSGNKGAEMHYYVNDAKSEIPAYSEAISSVEVIKELPDKYKKLPLIPRLMFRIEMGQEKMALAKVNFKQAAFGGSESA